MIAGQVDGREAEEAFPLLTFSVKSRGPLDFRSGRRKGSFSNGLTHIVSGILELLVDSRRDCTHTDRHRNTEIRMTATLLAPHHRRPVANMHPRSPFVPFCLWPLCVKAKQIWPGGTTAAPGSHAMTLGGPCCVGHVIVGLSCL